MRRHLALSVLVLLAAGPLHAGEARKFGKPLAGLAPTPIAKVLEAPEAGKSVRLEGKATGVCQNKGCWLELEQEGKSIHVTFEGYAFFVDKDIAGKPVVVEGKVMVEKPDPEKVEHLKKEGASAAAAAQVSLEATGVEVRAE